MTRCLWARLFGLRGCMRPESRGTEPGSADESHPFQGVTSFWAGTEGGRRLGVS